MQNNGCNTIIRYTFNTFFVGLGNEKRVNIVLNFSGFNNTAFADWIPLVLGYILVISQERKKTPVLSKCVGENQQQQEESDINKILC